MNKHANEKTKILLVEDNEDNLLMTQDYLENFGYQLLVARDGNEALAMMDEIYPDLILLDIQMPEMNGFEVLRHLRSQQRFASVPIIALTALAMPGDRERCLEAGANEYLSKPVELKLLLYVIEKLMGSSSSEN
jgi:CheY-like chemotaxis protein